MGFCKKPKSAEKVYVYNIVKRYAELSGIRVGTKISIMYIIDIS